MLNSQEDTEKLSLGVRNPEASVEGQAALEQGYELSLGSRFLSVRAHRLSPAGSRISPLHVTLWNPEGGSDALA